MTTTIGIDPGLSGAAAVLAEDGAVLLLADLPVIRDGRLAWIDGGALQSMLLGAICGKRCCAIVERVSAMPRQGVSSSFTFGVGLGSILATIQTLRIPLELVQASWWKRELGLSNDKRASLDKARLLFPTADLGLAKHDGRAEALLIAHWAMGRPGAHA